MTAKPKTTLREPSRRTTPKRGEYDVTAMTNPLPHRAAHTIRETRQLLGGIAPATIYGLIASGKLRTFKVGRRRFVSDEAIRDYIASAERETANNAA